MSTPADVIKALGPLEDHLFEKLSTELDRKIEGYRRSIWTKQEWCCHEMSTFAMDVWGVSKPRGNTVEETFGQVGYSLRNHHVNYCPFCGVKV